MSAPLVFVSTIAKQCGVNRRKVLKVAASLEIECRMMSVPGRPPLRYFLPEEAARIRKHLTCRAGRAVG